MTLRLLGLFLCALWLTWTVVSSFSVEEEDDLETGEEGLRVKRASYSKALEQFDKRCEAVMDRNRMKRDAEDTEGYQGRRVKRGFLDETLWVMCFCMGYAGPDTGRLMGVQGPPADRNKRGTEGVEGNMAKDNMLEKLCTCRRIIKEGPGKTGTFPPYGKRAAGDEVLDREERSATKYWKELGNLCKKKSFVGS